MNTKTESPMDKAYAEIDAMSDDHLKATWAALGEYQPENGWSVDERSPGLSMETWCVMIYAAYEERFGSNTAFKPDEVKAASKEYADISAIPQTGIEREMFGVKPFQFRDPDVPVYYSDISLIK